MRCAGESSMILAFENKRVQRKSCDVFSIYIHIYLTSIYIYNNANYTIYIQYNVYITTIYIYIYIYIYIVNNKVLTFVVKRKKFGIISQLNELI